MTVTEVRPVAPVEARRPDGHGGAPLRCSADAPQPRPVLGPALVLAAAAGLLAAWSPLLSIAVGLVLLLVTVVFLRPVLGTYVVLALTPLLVGMDRGALVPLLRPNEALAILVGGIVATRGAVLWLRGSRWPREVRRVELALVALAFTSSVLPVLWLAARGAELTADDLQYSIMLWKYFFLYLLVRCTVRSEQQVGRCLWIILGTSAAVGGVAILQSLQVPGVLDLVSTYYAPFGDEGAVTNQRGTSTLASSIAVGDVMAYSLAIALGWLLRGSRRRVPLVALSMFFVLGGLASGQFSGAIALLVAVAAVGFITGQLRRAAYAAVPAAALGALLLRPVIERRLTGFSSNEGLPRSWVGRLENLQTFFWPELFSDFNVVLGVRPSARVPAPETWRDYVWIESGHTWLLWSGGIPLFLAFFYFLWTALRSVARVARERQDAIGAAAVGCFSALCVLGVLMTLDLHLTLRGSADLLFPLLALALTREAGPGDPGASHAPARPSGTG